MGIHKDETSIGRSPTRLATVPRVQPAKIKGMVRAWARDWVGANEKELLRIFGPAPEQTSESDTGVNRRRKPGHERRARVGHMGSWLWRCPASAWTALAVQAWIACWAEGLGGFSFGGVRLSFGD
jgi:hypothetical protein